MVGVESGHNQVPLLPICHTTQKAQIEVVLDSAGNFRRARVIPRDEARTIIPCTEASGGRTSGEAPHPLCDKLQYVAKDYPDFGGSKKSYFASYSSQLTTWDESGFSHPKIRAIRTYIEKGNLIADLVAHNILIVNSDGKLLGKWDKKENVETPKIFDVAGSQEDAFVRWVVETPGDPEPRVWRDQALWNLWIAYYLSTREGESLCYVTGESELPAVQHLAKLRNDGDKAKLISSNDNDGFTYRGRFTDASQAAAVSLDVSQKAHLALRWLISRQGYRKGDLAIVAWSTSGKPIPKPTDDPLAFLGIDELPDDDPASSVTTAQEVAVRLKKKIAGYGQRLGDTSDIVVLGLDSATPGRMAITFYRELTGSEFLHRLEGWHESCQWLHRYSRVEVVDPRTGQTILRHVPFIGAPAPADIAEAAYGERADDRLKQMTILRLLPCIIDGQPIPRDLVESVMRRACNRIALEKWEWDKVLSIACSLIRKYYRKEGYEMTLDPARKTRDYLYGRLLALADNMEEWALSTANERRETNATRLMQRFAERPFTTWRTIELALKPYKSRLGKKANRLQALIDEVVSSFAPDDFCSDKRLSGEFLLGYHSQREDLRSHINKTKDTDDNEDN